MKQQHYRFTVSLNSGLTVQPRPLAYIHRQSRWFWRIFNKNELSQALSDINRLIIRKNIQETIQGDSLIQQNLKEIYEKINKKFRESDILLDEDNLTNNINNFKKLYNTLDIQDKNEKDINVSKDEFKIVE